MAIELALPVTARIRITEHEVVHQTDDSQGDILAVKFELEKINDMCPTAPTKGRMIISERESIYFTPGTYLAHGFMGYVEHLPSKLGLVSLVINEMRYGVEPV